MSLKFQDRTLDFVIHDNDHMMHLIFFLNALVEYAKSNFLAMNFKFDPSQYTSPLVSEGNVSTDNLRNNLE